MAKVRGGWGALDLLVAGLMLILAGEIGWAAKDLIPDFASKPKAVAWETRVARDEARIDAKVKEVLERPLFTNGREPPPPPPTPEELAAAQRPILKSRLSGISLLDNAYRALFVTAENKYVWVREGDELDGFKVASIGFNQVVLSSRFGDQLLQPSRSAPQTVRNTKPVELGNFEPDKPDNEPKK